MHNYDIPEGYDTRLLYRFLQSEYFDAEKTYKAIIEHKEFLAAHLPPKINNINKFHNNGVLYICNRDKSYRPVIIFDLGKLVETDMDTDDVLNYTIYLH